MNVGTRVRIERDEQLYPSRGTWPRFRGKSGTVVSINRDHVRPHLTEYGVTFGKTWTTATGRLSYNTEDMAWFKAHEMHFIGPQSGFRPPQITSEGDDTVGTLVGAVHGCS